MDDDDAAGVMDELFGLKLVKSSDLDIIFNFASIACI